MGFSLGDIGRWCKIGNLEHFFRFTCITYFGAFIGLDVPFSIKNAPISVIWVLCMTRIWSFVGVWRKPLTNVLYYVLLACPPYGQMLDVYQRPDLQVWTNKILSWQFATSVSPCKTAGPNTGLCIPMYMAGIRQTTTSEFLEDP